MTDTAAITVKNDSDIVATGDTITITITGLSTLAPGTFISLSISTPDGRSATDDDASEPNDA